MVVGRIRTHGSSGGLKRCFCGDNNQMNMCSNLDHDTWVLYQMGNFCYLIMAVVFAARDTAFCKTLISVIRTIENSLCSACGHPIQDTFHPILNCSAADSLRCSLSGNSSLYRHWSRPRRVARLLGPLMV